MKANTISFICNDTIESPCIRDSNCICKSDTNKIFKGHISLEYGSDTIYFNYIVDPYNAIKYKADKEGIIILSSNNINKTEETIEGHTIEVGKKDILLVIKNILYIYYNDYFRINLFTTF